MNALQRIAFLWPIGIGIFAALVGYLLNIGALLDSELTRLQSSGMLGLSVAAESLFLSQLLPATVWRRAMAAAALFLGVLFSIAFLGPVVELRLISLLFYFACSAIAVYVLQHYYQDTKTP